MSLTHAHSALSTRSASRSRSQNVRAPRRPLCKCSRLGRRLNAKPRLAAPLLLFVNAAAAAAATRFTSSESPERSTRWLSTKLPLPAPTITTPRGMRTKPAGCAMCRPAKLNLIKSMPIHRPEIAIALFAFMQWIESSARRGFTLQIFKIQKQSILYMFKTT
jgi:hypothetical protein